MISSVVKPPTDVDEVFLAEGFTPHTKEQAPSE